MNAPSPELARMLSADPLWYKDAIIYQLHVKSFFDCQQRRHRRLPRPDRQARLHRRPRRQHDLAAAVLSLAAARRRLRHRRLPRRPPRLRHDGRRQALHRRRPRARPARHHRAGDQPHLRPASRGSSARGTAKPGSAARDFYVWSDTDQKYPETRIIFIDTERSNWTWDPVAGAYYWHRFYSHQPDLNFDNPRVLEAVLQRDALLARHRRRRAAARRRALSRRARRHQQREPAGDARGPEEDPRRARRALSRPHAAGRGQPVAGGRQGLFRRGRRMPHGVPLPADAAHVHGAGARGPLPDHRHHAPDAGDPRRAASGRSSCAITTS